MTLRPLNPFRPFDPFRYGVRSITAAIRALFANGEQGWWYDPSDLSTLYQDSAGTTPVTAMEQFVGMMLDKSKGLVLGPELVTNGDFSNGLTGWVARENITANVVSGEAQVTFGGSLANLSQNWFASTSSLSIYFDRWLKITFDATYVSGGGNLEVGVGYTLGTSITSASNGGIKRSYSVYIASKYAPLTHPVVFGGTAGSVWKIDNVSSKELPGNHGFQTTLTKRMKVSRRVNLLVGTAALATQSTPTVAGAHTLKFTGAGSVTLSGTATGTYTAGTHAITCTAGTLTLTVAGAVNDADFRLSIDNHLQFQWVNTSTDYDDDPAKFPTLDVLDGIDDSAVTSVGGGGTTGFFFSTAIKVNGGAGANRTLFSDAGTNTGYIVRLNTSNQLELAAGNGTAYTTIATAGTLAVGAVDVVQAWDDGTNLNVRIGNGAVASVARPTVSAGTAACSIGQDNGASSGYFNGGFYSKIYRRNSAPTQSQRDSVLTYQRQKAMAA